MPGFALPILGRLSVFFAVNHMEYFVLPLTSGERQDTGRRMRGGGGLVRPTIIAMPPLGKHFALTH
jgi:hypothetical protein